MAVLRIIIYKLMARCSSMARGGTRRGLWPQQRPSLELRKFTASPPCPPPKGSRGPAEPQGVLGPLETSGP